MTRRSYAGLTRVDGRVSTAAGRGWVMSSACPLSDEHHYQENLPSRPPRRAQLVQYGRRVQRNHSDPMDDKPPASAGGRRWRPAMSAPLIGGLMSFVRRAAPSRFGRVLFMRPAPTRGRRDWHLCMFDQFGDSLR